VAKVCTAVDHQHALGRLAHGGKSGLQALERLGYGWRQPLVGLRQHHPSRLPQEKRRAHPILQQLHLITDGCLGHPQLFCRLGKALMAGGRLEGADGR